MRILRSPSNNIESVFGNQIQVYENTKYRLTDYILTFTVPETREIVVHNTMSGEIIVLSAEEFDMIKDGTVLDKNVFLYEYLIHKWFLVPEDFSEKSMVDLMRIKNNGKLDTMSMEAISKFVVLTTTQCNARCHYCYEQGFSKKKMDDKTANDVADFIISHGKAVTIETDNPDHPIEISWFGGEPTFNLKAMSIIIDKINASGLKLHSKMISNGYLLDKNVAAYLKDEGNLTFVQITLDGTDAEYNSVKDYIYTNDSNPYQTVCNNIVDLLDLGISVGIRLNVGQDNKDTLMKVVDDVATKILPKVKNEHNRLRLHMNTHIIFEKCNYADFDYDDDSLKIVYDNCRELDDHIRALLKTPLVNIMDKSKGMATQSCMICNPTMAVINPDGSLAKCEHDIENTYSTIYSDYLDADFAKLLSFKLLRATKAECATCPRYPICLISAKCGSGDICTDDYIKRENAKSSYCLSELYKYKDTLDFKAFLYKFKMKTNRVSTIELDTLQSINIDGCKYYILRDAHVYDNDYVAVIKADSTDISDLEVYRFKFTSDSGVELFGIERYEEYYVVYDLFNKMIEKSIINKILQNNNKKE